jgi:lytic murein transglycosylase
VRNGERAQRLYTGGCHARHGAPALGPEFRPQPNADYDAWVAAFRARARAEGITDATLDRGFAGQGFLPGVVERDRNQTEFRRTTEDYLALVASEEDVALGRSRVGPVRSTLTDIERSTGVDANVLAAIWGVETRFGTRLGEIPVVSATSTLAWEGRRGRFFEAQLLAALRIIQSGDTTTDRMTGSWAGAMGHTQLMPTVYQEYAVDFRGDGRREIWSDDPTDALASTANYLVRYNWRRGEPWGYEVHLPEGFDTAVDGAEQRAPRLGLAECGRAAGLRRGDPRSRAGRDPRAGGRERAGLGAVSKLQHDPALQPVDELRDRHRLHGDRLGGRRAAVAQLRAGRDRADADAKAAVAGHA